MAPPRIYCCSNGCLSSSVRRPELSFFKLPREIDRRNEWLRLMSREDLADKNAKSYVVCEEHFNAHEILRAEHRKNLKKNAMPSLNLPDMRSKEVVAFEVLLKQHSSTQTDPIDAICTKKPAQSSSVRISRKRKLQLKQMKYAKIIKLENVDNQSGNQQKELFNKLCDKFLSDEFAELAKAQALFEPNTKKKQYLSVTTEMNDKVMSILKLKVQNMTEKEKNCAIIMDLMDLKANLVYNTREDRIIGFHEVDGVQTPEPATAALVLILRGIVVNWKQPVGFALLSEYRSYEEITKWIDKLLEKLCHDVGLNIRALVSDMEPDTFNLAKERPISPEKPFFFHKRRKLFYVFDTSHLIKLVRDSLLVNDFNFQGCVANFEPIMQFYNQDKEKYSKLAPKLTERHINPNNVEKMEPQLAIQLLSNSVAAAILTYIDFYVIDESGRDTVKVIKLMNDLFDLLNSFNPNEDNVYKRPFSGESEQLDIFNEAINFFRSLKLVDRKNGRDVTSSAKFIEGFQITIGSIMLLLEDFKKKGITNILRTKRLSRDATEKFFTQIKSINDITGDPTSRQFISGFRELFITDIMKSPSDKDCSMEIAKLLTVSDDSEEPDDYGDDQNEASAFTIDESESNVRVKSSEYNQLEIPDKNTVVYLSSYLLKRCSEKHKGCQILNSYIAPAPEQRIHNFGADVRYQRYREYSKDTSSSLLVVPYDDFIKYVEMMEEEFRSGFKRKHIDRDIAASIYKEISELNFAPPCPCFPIVYLKKLFIRMRIFHTIQFNNKKMRTCGSKRKYFTVPNL